MKNDNKKHRIGIVDFALVDAGLSHHEALVYSYVQRFEKNKRPCFASIPHIAAELRFSECSTKRHIRRLITLNLLRQTTKGRGRYLNTTAVKLTRIKLHPNGVKLTLDRGQIELGDRGQNEPLPLKVLPIEDTNINLPVININILNSKSDKSDLDYAEFKRRFLANRHKTSTGNLDDVPD